MGKTKSVVQLLPTRTYYLTATRLKCKDAKSRASASVVGVPPEFDNQSFFGPTRSASVGGVMRWKQRLHRRILHLVFNRILNVCCLR